MQLWREVPAPPWVIAAFESKLRMRDFRRSLRFPQLPFGDLPVGRRAHVPVLLAAILTAMSVQIGSGGLGLVHAADIPDEKPALIAIGDFNRDGIADMVEATPTNGEESGPHFLTVLLGKADGTFTNVDSNNRIGTDPRTLVVNDFNGDGNPDVVVGDSDGSLVEFLGDGTGNLMRKGNLATFGSVVSIAVGHFTHDGKLDLVVSDIDSNSAEILLGAGDGSFRTAWSFQLPRSGAEFHISTADFNKDGIDDLVITSPDDENYEVMLGNGNGTFTYAPKLSHLKDPNSYCPT